MNDFAALLQQGTANAWFFIPTAILLGALHGLEPGHSKTMMAAFIIAIRGTITQAVLLGLSAALSHSLVIWALAASALAVGKQWNVESSEPYFQVGSGLIVFATALWMGWRTHRDIQAEKHHHHHGSSCGCGHDHGHDHGGIHVEDGDRKIDVAIYEDGIPPRFELRFHDKKGNELPLPSASSIMLETFREDGSTQTFPLLAQKDCLISPDEIPEPHEFKLLIKITQDGPPRILETEFTEHGHSHETEEYQDEHEKGHAREIEEHFANRQVTTGQIILFGLSGGLLPCPAAFSILVLCLQMKEFTLGFSLVLCFSVGLAVVLVSVGSATAWGMKHAAKKFKGFSVLARRAPYISSTILFVLGCYLIWSGARHLI